MELNPIDISQIVIQIIATGGAIVIKKIEQRPTRNENQTPIIDISSGSDEEVIIDKVVPSPQGKLLSILMWIIISITIINFSLFLGRSIHTDKTTNITLLYPTDFSEVNQKEIIRGSSQNLLDNQKIIVVVFNQEIERYYPQDQVITIEAKNTWSSIAYIGSNEDVGKKFDVIVLITNEEDSKYFDSYFIESRLTNNWIGMTQLPEEVLIYERITVTRK
jgi:hypothetical protein